MMLCLRAWTAASLVTDTSPWSRPSLRFEYAIRQTHPGLGRHGVNFRDLRYTPGHV